MIYVHEEVSKKTCRIAGVCVAATLAVPVLAAIFAPTAPLLVPLAVALPFISMTVLDSQISGDHHHA